MDIQSASITNFLTIGEAQLKLKDKGLVLVQGKNEDDPSAESNGAGKSSVADAICWAIYGETARGVKGDAVINDTAKKGTRVELTIKDGDDEYVIARHRKHKVNKNSLTLTKNGDNLTKGTDKLTQEEVNKVMGCSLDVFRAAVYAGQEAMPDLPGMTDKQLKLLVEEAAGVDRLQNAHDVAKGRLRKVTQERDMGQARLESMISRKNDAEERLKQDEQSEIAWDKAQTDKVEQSKDDAKALLQKAQTETAKIDAARRQEINAELSSLDQALQGRKNEEAQRDALSRAVQDAEVKRANLQMRANLTKTAVDTGKKSLDRIDEKVGTKCDECGKEYAEADLYDAKEATKRKLVGLLTEYKQQKAAVEDAVRARESAQKALDDFTASMTDVSETVAKQRALRDELKAFDDQQKAVDILKERAASLIRESKRLVSEQNPHTLSIVDSQRRIAELSKNIEESKQSVEEMSMKVEIATEAAEVFSPAGVRAHILDTVTPFLNERTSHYLGTMSDGNITALWSTLEKTKKGELREKFNIEVVNAKGAKSFAGLSGGEKRKVRLAASMALQDMVASRAIKPISLFVADEVDHALDEAGLERLMALLDEKAREKGTVLVISHNELSDWIREQAIVTKSGGYATVTGVLSAA